MRSKQISSNGFKPDVSGVSEGAIEAAAAAFLAAQPDFDIGGAPLNQALERDKTIASAPSELQPHIIDHLKALQRTQAISPDAETAAKLIARGLTSAYQIARHSEAKFVAAHEEALGEGAARTVHANAVIRRVANEQALMAMHEAVHGTGIRAIDVRPSAVRLYNKWIQSRMQGTAWLEGNNYFKGPKGQIVTQWRDGILLFGLLLRLLRRPGSRRA